MQNQKIGVSRTLGVLIDKDQYWKAEASFEAVWGLLKDSFEISEFTTLKKRGAFVRMKSLNLSFLSMISVIDMIVIAASFCPLQGEGHA